MKNIVCLFFVVLLIGVIGVCTRYKNEEKCVRTENIYGGYYKRLLAGKVFVEGCCTVEIERYDAGGLSGTLDSYKQDSGNFILPDINISYKRTKLVNISGVNGKGKIKCRIFNFYYSIKWDAGLRFFNSHS